MKAIALLARKGGVGKSTVAIHMGVLAQATGLKVLFFDLDPQRSLSAWWKNRASSEPPLIETDARRLSDLLISAAAEGYDLAVIDTPPAVTFDTARVAGAVDLVLIPVRPSILDILAVESTAAVVQAAKTPAMLILNACLPPRETGEAPATTEARTALGSLHVPVAATSLAQRIDFTRALNGGESVTEFAPASPAAAEMHRLWREVRKEIA